MRKDKEVSEDNKTFYQLGLNERNRIIGTIKKTSRAVFDQFNSDSSRYRQENKELTAKCGALEFEVADLKKSIRSVVAASNRCIDDIIRAIEEEPLLLKINGVCISEALAKRIIIALEKNTPYSKGLATQLKKQMTGVRPLIEDAIAEMKRNQVEDRDVRKALSLDE